MMMILNGLIPLHLDVFFCLCVIKRKSNKIKKKKKKEVKATHGTPKLPPLDAGLGEFT